MHANRTFQEEHKEQQCRGQGTYFIALLFMTDGASLNVGERMVDLFIEIRSRILEQEKVC